MEGLVLSEVTRRFGARTAVDKVTLAVRRGEVVCILGPSGCGKSTTLRLAAGLERADGGEVHVGGRLVEGKGVHVPPEERGVALMFQDYALFPHLSAKGNVAFGLSKTPRNRRNEIAMRELERVGLAHLAEAYPHTLSGGEQQRVALARMLAPGPEVVLMDEPFSGLDASLRDSLRAATLARLREAKAAVVIVTHDPDEAMRIGDRVALMRAGRIVQEGTPLEIYRNPCDPKAASLFGGANLFHVQVNADGAPSPFGLAPSGSLRAGEWAEVLYRPGDISVGERGVPARVLAVRPLAGGLEVEAALAPSAVPAGVEVPPMVRAAAPFGSRIAAGAEICLEAKPENAFVFPCADKVCRA